MRHAFILLVFAVGCSHPATVASIQPFIAVAGHYSMLASEKTPVSGVCPTCNGVGKLGDGKVFVTCATCNGTGRLTSVCKDKKCTTPSTAR